MIESIKAMENKVNTSNFLKQTEGLTERILQSQQNFLNKYPMYRATTTTLKTLTLLLCAIFLISCNNDDAEPGLKTTHSFYWETRHDAIPKSMQGEWVSVTDNTEIVLIVTDRFVMAEDFRIDREQDNVVRVNDSTLQMYQNDKFYALAFGSDGALTITANNDCYDTVVPFQQQQTNLN